MAAALRRRIDDLLCPDLFRALCDPTRVKLLACLAKCGRSASVSEVAECCSVDFSVVSRHLSLMADAGVLRSEKKGRAVMYAVRYEEIAGKLRALADAIEECRGVRRERLKVLFLCTGNSCRSQMAEGWARQLKSEWMEAYSAGTAPQGLNPKAVRAMAEAGVDISGQRSKSVEELEGVEFDAVITVCGEADRACPRFSGDVKVIHAGFDDPPRLEAGARSEEEALGHYRRVRDEIRAFVEKLPEALMEPVVAGVTPSGDLSSRS